MSATLPLYEAVYDAPDEDAPRRAPAEHPTRDGDVRGELIALQLDAASRGHIAREAQARIRSLLAAHASAWLAPLRGALTKTRVRWERGFPVAGQLAAPRRPDPLDALIGLRPLATLRALALELPNSILPAAWLERFVFETPLRALRGLSGVARAVLPRMLTASEPFAIESRVVSLEGGGGPLGEAQERAFIPMLAQAFTDGRGLPRLRDLSYSLNHAHGDAPERYLWLWTSALGGMGTPSRVRRRAPRATPSVVPARDAARGPRSRRRHAGVALWTPSAGLTCLRDSHRSTTSRGAGGARVPASNYASRSPRSRQRRV